MYHQRIIHQRYVEVRRERCWLSSLFEREDEEDAWERVEAREGQLD
jgi:hypothetical protein